MAHDPRRGRVVLFGGITGGASAGDTWEWDGTNWSQRAPATSPSARHGHALVYDASSARVLLFGGQDVTGILQDTWTWDGSNWLQLAPGSRPPLRVHHAMAADPIRSRVVLFGGRQGFGGSWFADTWAWDGANWLDVTSMGPAARQGHAMTWSAARRRIVLFGGASPSGAVLGDTWEWDGTTWHGQAPAHHPAARRDAALASDDAHGRVVLASGSSTQPLADTWIYGDLSPAATVAFGSACIGTNGPPLLSAGLATLGNANLTVDPTNARGQSPCLLALSAAPQNRALGGGCSLYVTDPLGLLASTSTASGFASFRLTVPLTIHLRGSAVFAQAMVLDPRGTFAGAAWTRGLGLLLGD
jgi:hypothetical protein